MLGLDQSEILRIYLPTPGYLLAGAHARAPRTSLPLAGSFEVGTGEI